MKRALPAPLILKPRGFTLLEIMMAMMVVSLLLVAVFGIVGGTTQMASELEHEQEKDAQTHSFAQFCERTFRSLPGSGAVRLRVKQNGNHYLGEIALKSAPSPFLGTVGAGNGLTLLQTEETTDGYLRVVVKYLGPKEARAFENGDASAAGNQQRLVLMENIAKCEWKFYNPRTEEWETVWNEKSKFDFPLPLDDLGSNQGGGNSVPPVTQGNGNTLNPNTPTVRPSLISLDLTAGAEAPRHFVFWMPPAQPPQLQNQPPLAIPQNGTSPPPNGVPQLNLTPPAVR